MQKESDWTGRAIGAALSSIVAVSPRLSSLSATTGRAAATTYTEGGSDLPHETIYDSFLFRVPDETLEGCGAIATN